VHLATALLQANTADVHLTDKALRVAEAAIAATSQRLGQAKQLAIQMRQQQLQQQLYMQDAAAAAAADLEDEELADTCSSCILQLPGSP
jgi:hypothetical protein